MEAWTAPDERFGRVDIVVSAGKRRVDQFPVIMKKNSRRTRQYQEMVSELMAVYKEHNFVHELNSQIPEANVAKLPVRLSGRWAEFVEGKSKRSTWESFVNWLEKEAKICESKQRWMPEKGEGLIRLGVIYLRVVHVSLVAIQCQDCLGEQHKRLPQLMKS